jgi:hypothetical protein
MRRTLRLPAHRLSRTEKPGDPLLPHLTHV